MKTPGQGLLIKAGLVVLLLVFAVSVFMITLTGNSATAAPDVKTALDPTKQAVLDNNATDKAIGELHPATYGPNPLTPPIELRGMSWGPTSTPRSGIEDSHEDPVNSEYAMVNKQWSGPLNGSWVRVYSGYYGQQPEQGVVFVLVNAPGDKGYSLKEFPIPVKEGEVTITAANGLVLTLVTKEGTTLHFDIKALAFK